MLLSICRLTQPGFSSLTIVAELQVLAVDPGQRGVSEGVPLMSGAPFLLQHCATKQVCKAVHYVPARLCNTL